MSAYFVGHEQINLIISYMEVKREKLRNKNFDEISYKEAAQILVDENIRSLNSRYGESSNDMYSDEELKINYKTVYPKPYFYGMDSGKINHVNTTEPRFILSLIKCYECQSCESNDYKDTEAHHIINTIKEDCIRQLASSMPYGFGSWEQSKKLESEYREFMRRKIKKQIYR